jgi:hypothetical protein
VAEAWRGVRDRKNRLSNQDVEETSDVYSNIISQLEWFFFLAFGRTNRSTKECKITHVSPCTTSTYLIADSGCSNSPLPSDFLPSSPHFDSSGPFHLCSRALSPSSALYRSTAPFSTPPNPARHPLQPLSSAHQTTLEIRPNPRGRIRSRVQNDGATFHSLPLWPNLAFLSFRYLSK